MISAELQFFLKNLVNQILNMEYIPIEPLAFVYGDARAETNRSCTEGRSGAPYFSYAVMRVLKVINIVWSVDWEPLAFCM
jgi:hypothetical protein